MSVYQCVSVSVYQCASAEVEVVLYHFSKPFKNCHMFPRTIHVAPPIRLQVVRFKVETELHAQYFEQLEGVVVGAKVTRSFRGA